uniref:V-type proton ATPase subunit E n=1 Tax=Aegilops tauschii TaxID=37682 RepID=M8BUQ3_AEGTA
MNDTDVSKQIQQMVRFIRQEAEEKAGEISVSAEEISREKKHLVRPLFITVGRGNTLVLTSSIIKYSSYGMECEREFNIEKLQLVEAEKKKIRQEYERKEKQVDVRKKIEYSMQLNASRIKVLQAQDDLVNKMKEDAMKELLNISSNHHEYRNLLKELVVQGLLRLKEPAVLLRCRKEDHHNVESVMHSAKNEYASKADVHEPEILVDHTVYLPPSPSHGDEHGQICHGGVVLASRDGKIVFENTVDARLEVVFRKKLPERACHNFLDKSTMFVNTEVFKSGSFLLRHNANLYCDGTAVSKMAAGLTPSSRLYNPTARAHGGRMCNPTARTLSGRCRVSEFGADLESGLFFTVRCAPYR